MYKRKKRKNYPKYNVKRKLKFETKQCQFRDFRLITYIAGNGNKTRTLYKVIGETNK